MQLLRETIKGNFQTGDKPTQADFEQFINSGFNLHQFTYDATYPYEAGNLVYGLYLTKPSLYRRTNYSIGEVGVPVTNSAYWMPLIVNIYNFPIVLPGETPIDAPFAILNEDKSLIRYTNDQTDALPPIIQGKTLLFEERSYNMPGANVFKWELIDVNSQQAIDTKYTRDYQWSFSQVGTFKVKLSVYEFGIETPVTTEYPISVSGTLIPLMTMTVVANPTTYNSFGSTIDFAITYTNTGDYPITNITTSATIGSQQLSVQEISSLPVGQSTTVNTTYITSSNDAGLDSITLNATGQGTTTVGVVTANGSASVVNGTVLGNVTITQDFMYRTAYINEPFILPITGTITPNVSSRIPSITYIKSTWISNTTRDYPVPPANYLGAIPDGTSFSYNFNINTLISTTINEVTLRYKDPYTVEAVSPSILFYGQNKVSIQSVTLAKVGEQIRVVVVTNKPPSVFNGNTNTYTIYERLDTNDFVEVPSGNYTESGVNRKTFTFFTNLLEDGVSADYSIKVIENLGGMAPEINGGNMTSESIKQVSWTVEPKVYYGEILGQTTLYGLSYGRAWEDHFVPAQLSETPWRILDVSNPSSVFIDWYAAGYNNQTFIYPFVAFPKSIYPNAFTILKDASGNIVSNGINNNFFVFDKTINGVEYRVYTLKGNGAGVETHGNSGPPFVITLE